MTRNSKQDNSEYDLSEEELAAYVVSEEELTAFEMADQDLSTYLMSGDPNFTSVPQKDRPEGAILAEQFEETSLKASSRSSATKILEVCNVSKSFPSPGGPTQVLDDVSFEVNRGEIICFFGPNGSGKSTLMNIISGIASPDAGTAKVYLERTSSIPVVFQDYRRSLLPWLDAGHNVTFPLDLAGVSRREQAERLHELLGFMGVSIDPKARIKTLSGGQAQLLCLLRALIIKPEILICDEPFSALDYHASLTLRQQLMDVANQMNLTVLFIGHDLDEVLYLADRVVFLKPQPGSIVADLRVDIARPRRLDMLTMPRFATLKHRGLQIFLSSLGTSSRIAIDGIRQPASRNENHEESATLAKMQFADQLRSTTESAKKMNRNHGLNRMEWGDDDLLF